MYMPLCLVSGSGEWRYFDLPSIPILQPPSLPPTLPANDTHYTCIYSILKRGGANSGSLLGIEEGLNRGLQERTGEAARATSKYKIVVRA